MPGHHGGPSISGSKPKPSKPSKPSSPSGYFGSMYTSPGSSFTGSGSSEEEDKKIDKILGGGSSGGGSGGGSNNDSNNQEDKKTPTEIVEDTTAKVVDVFTREEIKKLSPLQLQEAQNLLNNYKKLGETNPLKLRNLMMSNVLGGIFGKDQTVSDMEGNVVKPEDAFDNDGNLKEGFRFTREGIIGQLEKIDPEMNIMKSLEFYEPQLIMENFGLPQTSAGLDKFANLQLTNNKTTDAMIIEARERLAEDRERQDRASGVMSMPAFATAPGQDAPPKPGPGFTPDEPSGPSFTPQNTSPFDLSQFYAGLPSYSYGQQGVMSPNINPDLASYFENLKKYYGVG